MNYKSFNLGDWIGHISGVIEDESELDGNEMRDLVEFLSMLEQEPKWIPVTERLPEEKKAVLIWCPQYKNLYCAYRENEQWWIFGSYSHRIVDDVVAWMPYDVLLPEPYGYGTEMEQ